VIKSGRGPRPARFGVAAASRRGKRREIIPVRSRDPTAQRAAVREATSR
jgi:hypothetical protein